MVGSAGSGEQSVVQWRGAGILPPLPEAEAEARRVAALRRERSRLLLGGAATEDQVMAGMQSARLAHFAAPALADAERPLDSALVLAPGVRLGRFPGLRPAAVAVMRKALRARPQG